MSNILEGSKLGQGLAALTKIGKYLPSDVADLIRLDQVPEEVLKAEIERLSAAARDYAQVDIYQLIEEAGITSRGVSMDATEYDLRRHRYSRKDIHLHEIYSDNDRTSVVDLVKYMVAKHMVTPFLEQALALAADFPEHLYVQRVAALLQGRTVRNPEKKIMHIAEFSMKDGVRRVDVRRYELDDTILTPKYIVFSKAK